MLHIIAWGTQKCNNDCMVTNKFTTKNLIQLQKMAIFKLNQLILWNTFNTVLDVAFRAQPITWVEYAIVTAAFLAIRPASLVLLVHVGGNQNQNSTMEISCMMRCDCIIMHIAGQHCILQLIILWCTLEKRVVNHLLSQLMPEIEHLGEVVGVFIEHKMLHIEVSIDIRDRKEIRKDKDQLWSGSHIPSMLGMVWWRLLWSSTAWL